MEQYKLKLWNEKIEPILRKKFGLEKIIEKRLEKIDFNGREKKWTKNKMKIANRAGLILGRIASVKFVGVTGSVASDWPKRSDDIDLLIVSADNRLWLNRIIITLILRLSGFDLRKKNIEKTNSLCLNMWLEERSLTIEKSRQNILAAFDLMWIKVIVDRDDCLEKLLSSNLWIKKYVKTGVKNRQNVEVKEIKDVKILKGLNWLAYKIQYLYMKRKIKKEIVRLDRAYFHPKGKIHFDRI